MKAQGHQGPELAGSPATKLFTVGRGHDNAALALPTMNNFG
jgi:hypothetical protein